MPELPEVEPLRSQLALLAVGSVIEKTPDLDPRATCQIYEGGR